MERFSDSMRHVTQHTLKEKEQENERIQSENLNLKLRVQYLEDLLGENSDTAPTYWDLQSALSKERERIIEEAAREVSERDELLAAAKRAQDELRLENSNLLNKIEQLESAISELNHQFESKEENNRLQQERAQQRAHQEIERAKSMEREAVEKQYAYAQKIERDTHEKEIADLRERWQQWHDAEIDRVKAEVTTKHSAQLDSLNAEVSRYQMIIKENSMKREEELALNESTYQSLQDQFAKQSMDMKNLQGLLDEKVQTLDNLKQEFRSLESTKQALQKSVERKDMEISQLDSAKKALQSDLDVYKINEEAYKLMQEKFSVEGLELKEELQDAKEKLTETSKTISDLKERLHQEQVDKEKFSKLQDEVQDARSRMLELEQNLIRSEKQRQEMARELDFKRETLIEKEAEVAELTSELNSVEQKMRRESNSATCAQEKLLAEIQLLRLSMQENESERERDQKLSETNALLRYHEAQDGRGQQVEALKKKIKQLDSLLDLERVKVGSLREEMHKAQRNAEERLEEAQAEGKERINKVYEQLKLKTLECARLQSEIKMLREEWDNARDADKTVQDYGSLAKENFRLRKEMEILQRSLADTREAAQQALRERELAFKSYERRQKELQSSAHQQQETAERLIEDMRMQLDKATSSRQEAGEEREVREICSCMKVLCDSLPSLKAETVPDEQGLAVPLFGIGKVKACNNTCSVDRACRELQSVKANRRVQESEGGEKNQDSWRELKAANETIHHLEKEHERISSKYSILKEK
eukprot:760403-Hanusia_phi.AAC.11